MDKIDQSAAACGYCIYWRAGECRRHAPQGRLDPIWPRTASGDWCGEFKPGRALERAPVEWTGTTVAVPAAEVIDALVEGSKKRGK